VIAERCQGALATAARIEFVGTAPAAPPAVEGTAFVVLDTAWTPSPEERPDLVPLRPFVAPVLSRIDTFRVSLDRLDTWASTAGIPDLMTVDGVCWWFRLRPRLADSLNELILWSQVAGELLAPSGAVDRPRSSERTLVVPPDEPALAAALRAVAASSRFGSIRVVDAAAPSAPQAQPPIPSAAGVSFVARFLVDRQRRGRRAELARRRSDLEARVVQLASRPRRVLVIAQPRIYQTLATAQGTRVADPQLAPVMARLTERGITPIVVGLGLDHRDDELWKGLRAEPDLLPQSALDALWSDPADRLIASAGLPGLLEARSDVRLEVDGVDLAPPILGELSTNAGEWLESQRRQVVRIGRLITDLRPQAVFLNHEGARTPWLAAARAAGVPILAVQHGLIFPHHSVYRHQRHPGLILPDCTYTFGPYERDVLVRDGTYRPDEVAVAGSPRLDIDAVPIDGDAATLERDAVRRELGVAPGSRLLVVSTAHTVPFRRFLLPNLIDRLLSQPMPGVHVVFKQHPGELDEGPYRRLMQGLARSGGYPEIPVGVVRDVDLNRLLRAADAHLGLHSTVLTDAVVVGTPNLIALTQAYSDLLGYVDAGVAQPVATALDLRRAMDHPPVASATARAAFLAAHFAPGHAADRIADAIAAAIGQQDPR
jgi:hypothetical protein